MRPKQTFPLQFWILGYGTNRTRNGKSDYMRSKQTFPITILDYGA